MHCIFKQGGKGNAKFSRNKTSHDILLFQKSDKQGVTYSRQVVEGIVRFTSVTKDYPPQPPFSILSSCPPYRHIMIIYGNWVYMKAYKTNAKAMHFRLKKDESRQVIKHKYHFRA